MGTMEEFDENKSIVRSFETVGAYAGRSLRLAYNLNTTSNWNGYFLRLNSGTLTKNISAYRQLSFWVKGEVGGVEHLKIELENEGAVGRKKAYLYVTDYLDGGITNGWKKVSIPLDAFANLDSKDNAKNLNFVFERSYADNGGLARTGVVFIDDVRFSDVSLGFVRIDHFGDNWGWGALGGNQGDVQDSGGLASHSYDATDFKFFSRSFKSTYNVNSGFSGHYFKIGGGLDGNAGVPCNFSRYHYIKFWIKAGTGNPKALKVELKSGVNSALIPVTGITTDWSQKVVSIDGGFESGTLNKAGIYEMVIIYEGWRISNASGSKTGTVWFDGFEFSETP